MDWYHGIFGILILIADIWAIVHIVGSAATTLAKVLWIALVLILPILGFFIWLFFGPRAAR